MGIYIGLDVGTTSLSALALDSASGHVVAQAALPNTAAISHAGPRGHLYAELELTRLHELLVELLQRLGAQLPHPNVAAIGVTGQQHGLALLSADLTPVGPAITWQDQRALESAGSGETYLQAMLAAAGGALAFEPTGCLPAAGYAGATLYWLARQGRLPTEAAHACLIPDAAVALLTGTPPCTDATNAGSTGLFDIVSGDWLWSVIARLGLPSQVFPAVREAGSLHAPLSAAIAKATGLGPVPVCVASGDNQTSFLGSVRDMENSVLINVGTGGQISAVVDGFQRLAGLETRAFFAGRYLLVGAGLYGGRAYAYLRDLFRQIGVAFWGADPSTELYEEMNRLAAQAPPGADGLRCEPLFTGTRANPDLRASFTGIGPTNLTPGHLARALLEGLAEGFYSLYSQMQPVIGAREMLVGAGNGILQNPLLADIVARRFGRDLYMASDVEAAALGAAMLACAGLGEMSLTELSSVAHGPLECAGFGAGSLGG